MKSEASLVACKRSELGQRNKTIRKKWSRKTKCRPPFVPSTIQKLFSVCKEMFKGPGTVPPPPDAQKLQHILDQMIPEDLGLSKDLLLFKENNSINGAPTITYTTVYNCQNFSLCMFFLPQRAVIPLHNHPGMTVFSKLLLGTMHIKAYDWVDPTEADGAPPSSKVRLARSKEDSIFTAPCNTSVLYPSTGGNIHAFTAITPCVVLDVLGPPYSIEDDRDCSYYKEISFSTFNDVSGQVKDDCSYTWLEETEIPEDLKMDVVDYLGPQIFMH